MKHLERESSEAVLPASKMAAAEDARAERSCLAKATANDMALPCADLTCPCRIVRKR